MASALLVRLSECAYVALLWSEMIRYLGFVEAVAVHLMLDGASDDVGDSAVDVDRVRSARRQILATPTDRPHTSNTINVVRPGRADDIDRV